MSRFQTEEEADQLEADERRAAPAFKPGEASHAEEEVRSLYAGDMPGRIVWNDRHRADMWDLRRWAFEAAMFGIPATAMDPQWRGSEYHKLWEDITQPIDRMPDSMWADPDAPIGDRYRERADEILQQEFGFSLDSLDQFLIGTLGFSEDDITSTSWDDEPKENWLRRWSNPILEELGGRLIAPLELAEKVSPIDLGKGGEGDIVGEGKGELSPDDFRNQLGWRGLSGQNPFVEQDDLDPSMRAYWFGESGSGNVADYLIPHNWKQAAIFAGLIWGPGLIARGIGRIPLVKLRQMQRQAEREWMQHWRDENFGGTYLGIVDDIAPTGRTPAQGRPYASVPRGTRGVPGFGYELHTADFRGLRPGTWWQTERGYIGVQGPRWEPAWRRELGSGSVQRALPPGTPPPRVRPILPMDPEIVSASAAARHARLEGPLNYGNRKAMEVGEQIGSPISKLQFRNALVEYYSDLYDMVHPLEGLGGDIRDLSGGQMWIVRNIGDDPDVPVGKDHWIEARIDEFEIQHPKFVSETRLDIGHDPALRPHDEAAWQEFLDDVFVVVERQQTIPAQTMEEALALRIRNRWEALSVEEQHSAYRRYLEGINDENQFMPFDVADLSAEEITAFVEATMRYQTTGYYLTEEQLYAKYLDDWSELSVEQQLDIGLAWRTMHPEASFGREAESLESIVDPADVMRWWKESGESGVRPASPLVPEESPTLDQINARIEFLRNEIMRHGENVSDDILAELDYREQQWTEELQSQMQDPTISEAELAYLRIRGLQAIARDNPYLTEIAEATGLLPEPPQEFRSWAGLNEEHHELWTPPPPWASTGDTDPWAMYRGEEQVEEFIAYAGGRLLGHELTVSEGMAQRIHDAMFSKLTEQEKERFAVHLGTVMRRLREDVDDPELLEVLEDPIFLTSIRANVMLDMFRQKNWATGRPRWGEGDYFMSLGGDPTPERLFEAIGGLDNIVGRIGPGETLAGMAMDDAGTAFIRMDLQGIAEQWEAGLAGYQSPAMDALLEAGVDIGELSEFLRSGFYADRLTNAEQFVEMLAAYQGGRAVRPDRVRLTGAQALMGFIWEHEVQHVLTAPGAGEAAANAAAMQRVGFTPALEGPPGTPSGGLEPTLTEGGPYDWIKHELDQTQRELDTGRDSVTGKRLTDGYRTGMREWLDDYNFVLEEMRVGRMSEGDAFRYLAEKNYDVLEFFNRYRDPDYGKLVAVSGPPDPIEEAAFRAAARWKEDFTVTDYQMRLMWEGSGAEQQQIIAADFAQAHPDIPHADPVRMMRWWEGRDPTRPSLFESAPSGTPAEGPPGTPADPPPPVVIHGGRGLNLILSNWGDTPLEFRGVTFRSAEGAYHAHKSGNYVGGFQNLTGRSAYNRARNMPIQTDRSITDDLMQEILEAKFAQNPDAMEALLATGSAELLHPVTDRHWGSGYRSDNAFARMLMEIRDRELGGGGVGAVPTPAPAGSPAGGMVDEGLPGTSTGPVPTEDPDRLASVIRNDADLDLFEYWKAVADESGYTASIIGSEAWKDDPWNDDLHDTAEGLYAYLREKTSPTQQHFQPPEMHQIFQTIRDFASTRLDELERKGSPAGGMVDEAIEQQNIDDMNRVLEEPLTFERHGPLDWLTHALPNAARGDYTDRRTYLADLVERIRSGELTEGAALQEIVDGIGYEYANTLRYDYEDDTMGFDAEREWGDDPVQFWLDNPTGGIVQPPTQIPGQELLFDTGPLPVTRIISGGQIGADQAGWVVGTELGLETGGEMPHGFRTHFGSDPEVGGQYGATTNPSSNWSPRTLTNVTESDATIMFPTGLRSTGAWLVDPTAGELLPHPIYAGLSRQSPGTRLTVDYAQGNPGREIEAADGGRPFIVVSTFDPTPEQLQQIRDFFIRHNVQTLNVAGSRGLSGGGRQAQIDSSNSFRDQVADVLRRIFTNPDDLP